MKQKLITDIESQMQRLLDNSQLEELHKTLEHYLQAYEISLSDCKEVDEPDFITMFLAAKRIEGRSEKSLKYYQATIEKLVQKIGKTVKHITTDDLRSYLATYQEENGSSKVTIDNIYILKNSQMDSG
ncbi:phage integrase N-terminal SAM-like domain-containing protein [Dysosmobacter sp.]